MKPTHLIVYRDPRHYSAFPDIVRLRNDDLAVVLRECDVHDRTGHVDPTSRIVLMRSRDDGRTWPVADRVVVDPGDGGIHDLNLAMMSEIGERLIVNNFRFRLFSLDEEAEAMRFERERMIYRPGQGYPYGFAVIAGIYSMESGDCGQTWGPAQRVVLPLPDYYIHTGKNGAVRLPDGTHVLPFHGRMAEDTTDKVFIVRSKDGCRTWSDPTIVADDPVVSFHEPAVARLRSGRLLAMLRTADADGYLYQTSSEDDGRTWSGLRRTELWGHPAHILQLKSGSVLCAYGYRREPYGVRVAFSADDGETWDERTLRDDGLRGDLGYPASVQLADERILTVYYFHDEEGVRFIAGSVYTE